MSLRTRLLVGLAVLVFAAVASAGWSVLAVARTRLQDAGEARAHVVGGAGAAPRQHARPARGCPGGGQVAALVEHACTADGCRGREVMAAVSALVESGAAPELVAVDGDGRLVIATGDARALDTTRDTRLGAALGGVPSAVRSGDALY